MSRPTYSLGRGEFVAATEEAMATAEADIPEVRALARTVRSVNLGGGPNPGCLVLQAVGLEQLYADHDHDPSFRVACALDRILCERFGHGEVHDHPLVLVEDAA